MTRGKIAAMFAPIRKTDGFPLVESEPRRDVAWLFRCWRDRPNGAPLPIFALEPGGLA
jgi:hypothetical protein